MRAENMLETRGVLRFNRAMFVDRAAKTLTFKVTVRGERVVEWFRSVAKAIGATSAPDDPGELLMLPLTLRDVKGWQVEFHLYATTSTFPGPRLLTLKSADAVVELFEGVSESARAARVASLSQDLTAFGYDPETFPRFEHTDPAEEPMELVKKVSRRLLADAREQLDS